MYFLLKSYCSVGYPYASYWTALANSSKQSFICATIACSIYPSVQGICLSIQKGILKGILSFPITSSFWHPLFFLIPHAWILHVGLHTFDVNLVFFQSIYLNSYIISGTFTRHNVPLLIVHTTYDFLSHSNSKGYEKISFWCWTRSQMSRVWATL